MKINHLSLHALILNLLAIVLILGCSDAELQDKNYSRYPSNKHEEISPDTHLKITFGEVPKVGKSGTIKVYDASNDSLVDQLDLSIPSGPTEYNKNPDAEYIKEPYEYATGIFTNANTKPGTPTGGALPTTDDYQLTIIGGFTDGFRFYPIIVHDSTAIIHLHHNLLSYNKTYYVLVDSTVLSLENDQFKGFYNKNDWQFSTRKKTPEFSKKELINFMSFTIFHILLNLIFSLLNK